MRNAKQAKLTSYSPFSAMIVALGFLASSADTAQALTADDVMNKMNEDQQFGYISGIVSGLAQARWIKDNPDDTGSACVNDWFFDNVANVWPDIEAWFARHPDKPAGALLFVLIKKECGW